MDDDTPKKGITLHGNEAQFHKFRPEIQSLGPVFTTAQTSLPKYDMNIHEKFSKLSSLIGEYNDLLRQYHHLRRLASQTAIMQYQLEISNEFNIFIRFLPTFINGKKTPIQNLYTPIVVNGNVTELNKYKIVTNNQFGKEDAICNSPYFLKKTEDDNITFESNDNVSANANQILASTCKLDHLNHNLQPTSINLEDCLKAAYSTYGTKQHQVVFKNDGNYCKYANKQLETGQGYTKYTFKSNDSINTFNSNIENDLYYVKRDLNTNKIEQKVVSELYDDGSKPDHYDKYDNFLLVEKNLNSKINLYDYLSKLSTSRPINDENTLFKNEFNLLHSRNSVKTTQRIYNTDDLTDYVLMPVDGIPGIQSASLYIRKRKPSGFDETAQKSGKLTYNINEKSNGSGSYPEKLLNYQIDTNIESVNQVSHSITSGLLDTPAPTTTSTTNDFTLDETITYGDGSELATQTQQTFAKLKNEYQRIVNEMTTKTKEIHNKIIELRKYRTMGGDDSTSDLLGNLNPTTKAITNQFDNLQGEGKKISAGYANHLTNENMNLIMEEIGKNYTYILKDQEELEKLYLMGEDTMILGKSEYHMYVIYLLVIIMVLYGLYRASK